MFFTALTTVSIDPESPGSKPSSQLLQLLSADFECKHHLTPRELPQHRGPGDRNFSERFPGELRYDLPQAEN